MGTELREEILKALKQQAPVRREGKGWLTCCPNPGHTDEHPSFHLYPGGGGRCFSQCNSYWAPQELAKLLGIQMPVSIGLTVAQLAQAKRLSVKHLNSVGVADGFTGNKQIPCVEIPYYDVAGSVIAV